MLVDYDRIGELINRVQGIMGTRTLERDFLCRTCEREMELEEITAGYDRLIIVGLPELMVKHMAPVCPACVTDLLACDIAGMAMLELLLAAMARAAVPGGGRVIIEYSDNGDRQGVSVLPQRPILAMSDYQTNGKTLLSLERVI